ncbi:MAG TPA: response regulator transcription factor [Gammaproteobacteria bacterium]|nr:response regulator transcription factor [Gammaproteobacteria bacterium]
MRILLVEDEDVLRQQLEKTISAAGFVVESAADGKSGLFQGREYSFDLAIVDLGLPLLSGIEVIRQWRNAGRDFPILILTARGLWQEKVEGLEAGADDYMVKPFSTEELLARLRALLRRSTGWSQSRLKCGPVHLDLTTQSVEVDGKPVEMTAYEYRILEFLMLHAGEVISKMDMTEHIYHQDFDRDSNVIEVLVGRLRKKIDPDNSVKPIETLRGRGYRFALSRSD